MEVLPVEEEVLLPVVEASPQENHRHRQQEVMENHLKMNWKNKPDEFSQLQLHCRRCSSQEEIS